MQTSAVHKIGLAKDFQIQHVKHASQTKASNAIPMLADNLAEQYNAMELALEQYQAYLQIMATLAVLMEKYNVMVDAAVVLLLALTTPP